MSPDRLHAVRQAQDGDLLIEFDAEFWRDTDLEAFEARVETVLADIRISIYYEQLAHQTRH